MDPDDHVCVCFRVSMRKLVNYMNQTQPGTASQLSECLGAGTGCHWCVPYLHQLHEMWVEGKQIELTINQDTYKEARKAYRSTGQRPDDAEPTDQSQQNMGDHSDQSS